MTDRIENKVVVITGASSGLGAAVSRAAPIKVFAAFFKKQNLFFSEEKNQKTFIP
jgi:NADP-dependent 3-hydroxy acid dehydrogenase YdfG